MPENDNAKKKVWINIYRLVKPYKARLLSVFIISMLATAITLAEPLIYREAINDIAGLFVQQAREDAVGQSTDDYPSIPFFDRLTGADDTASLMKDSTIYTYDTLHYIKDTIIVKTLKKGVHARHHRRKIVTLKEDQKIPAVKIVKEPHTRTYVAPRTPAQAFDTLLWAIVLLFIINTAGLLFWRIGENMNVKLSCTIERNFIRKTFDHVLKLPLSFFAKRSSAALHKQIDQREEISGTVTRFTKDIFPEIVSLTGITVIMFWQNYILALLALSIVPFYILITVRSTKKLEMSLAGYYEKWENVSAGIQDALAGIKTVKLSGAEEREVNRLDKQSGEAYADYIQRSVLSHKYSLWQILLTKLATALVLSYGGYLALHHKLTPGDVVMFVAYLDMLYSPIDNLAEIWAELHQNLTSVARTFKLLDIDAPARKNKELEITDGKVEFKNVSFGYSSERRVLNNLSFIAQPGQITALVGTSGAGKTTTVDLILKLFEPQEGEIFIDGQSLAEIDESSVRRSVGMVTADGAIFRGTLADNIRYKKPDATNKEVEAAAIAAGMKDTLQRLPDGLMSLVGENGFGLSVGERQRLQIARVIVDKPKLLIMDEATANLDYATEAEVKKTMEEISKNNTVIIIAHRYSMVKDVNQVIVLDAGTVIQQGSPAELIGQDGWFTEFANAGEVNEEEDPEDAPADYDDADEEEEED